ncbi:DNA repair protein rad14 [Coemansia sp. RSA 2599]|nr:DNA repair protein rad14 [Coemansia sp. RSA 2599]
MLLKRNQAVTLDSLLELDQIGSGVFVSRRLWGSPAAKNIFGGQLVGLGLAAAFRTVDQQYISRSLHVQFLRQVVRGLQVEFRVQGLVSACKIVTRTVLGYQDGQPVMQMVCNFMQHRVAESDEPGYQKPMPDVPFPGAQADCPFVLDPQGYPEGFPAKIWATSLDHDHETPGPPRQTLWIESPEASSRTAQNNQCILAMYSDVHFTRVIVRPFGIRIAPASKCLRRIVSADHHIWFHRANSDCLLFDTHCPQLHGGRGIVQSQVYCRDGHLVATVVQEGRVDIDRGARLPKPKL